MKASIPSLLGRRTFSSGAFAHRFDTSLALREHNQRASCGGGTLPTQRRSISSRKRVTQRHSPKTAAYPRYRMA
jgi:hypothetical protein